MSRSNDDGILDSKATAVDSGLEQPTPALLLARDQVSIHSISTSPHSELVQFYIDEKFRPKGSRWSLSQILRFSDEQLERVHDFIQWLFPLREKSSFNINSVTLSDQDVADFRNSELLQSRLRDSFLLMVQFYGFSSSYNEIQGWVIAPAKEFEDRKWEWATPTNHNYQRISRILKSIYILGLEKEALAFYMCLNVNIYEAKRIDEGSFLHWQRAVNL